MRQSKAYLGVWVDISKKKKKKIRKKMENNDLDN